MPQTIFSIDEDLGVVTSHYELMFKVNLLY